MFLHCDYVTLRGSRPTNQDNLRCGTLLRAVCDGKDRSGYMPYTSPQLFAVTDGCGGESSGAEAAQYALLGCNEAARRFQDEYGLLSFPAEPPSDPEADPLPDELTRLAPPDAKALLKSCLLAADNSVRAFQRMVGGTPAATLSLCVVDEPGVLYWLAIGDSPIWLLHADGTAELLTARENAYYAQLALREADPPEPKARPLPQSLKSHLIRAVGGHLFLSDEDILQRTGRRDLEDGDRILLATDGFTEAVDVNALPGLLKKGRSLEALARAVARRSLWKKIIAKLRGNDCGDNCTAILISYVPTAPETDPEPEETENEEEGGNNE